MASKLNSGPKPPAKEKAEVMIAKPGQRFVAQKDCFIDRCIKEGEDVQFAPGQVVPLNLVRLVEAETEAESASTDEIKTGSEDSQQDDAAGGETSAAASGGDVQSTGFTA